MIHQQIKDLFFSSVDSVVSDISKYTFHPDSDFQRSRKIPANKIISFLVSQGSSSTRTEMLDFWNLDSHIPTASALNQQRAKLKPEALEAVFHHFNSSTTQLQAASVLDANYCFQAVDGSDLTYFSTTKFSSQDFFFSPGHSINGVYSMHLNALYDLDTHTYTDALIQSAHCKNEYRAFCDLVDRHNVTAGKNTVYIGDRGYCSYNNMAHVIKQGQYFLFRTKGINSKGMIHKFDFPKESSFDIDVNVTLVRSHSKKVLSGIPADRYIRFIDHNTAFDYIKYGSYGTYELSFRVVCFPISESTYEYIVTNLPRDEFPVERIKILYNARWSIESSFRKLKYTIGLSNFHAYKPNFIKQEIWAKLLAYNITETMINQTVLEEHQTKHKYKVNFTLAAHICRVFLRLTTEKDQYDVMSLLKRELIPIRNDRQYSRLQTAHFRRPRYFIYRAA